MEKPTGLSDRMLLYTYIRLSVSQYSLNLHDVFASHNSRIYIMKTPQALDNPTYEPRLV